MAAITSTSLVQEDEQLNNETFKALHAKYAVLASDEQIAATKAGLESKGHAATVVANGAEALALIQSLIPNGSSVYNTGSTSLGQIGFVELLKEKKEWDNLHGKAFVESGGDFGKMLTLLRKANAADYVVTTVDGIAETGEFIVADGSSTRIAAYGAAGNLVVLAGANKLVKTIDAARERLHSYVLPLESARMRKAMGKPGSLISNELVVNTNSLSAGRIHFVIVKEHLGF